MNNDTQNDTEYRAPESLKEALMRRIAADDIAMRPKVYFTAKLIGLGALAFLILAMSVFIFDFLLFSVHSQASDAFLHFGARGIAPFLQAFPWSLFILDVLLALLFMAIVRRHYHGYRRPILWGFAAIFLGMMAVGIVIDAATPVNSFLRDGGRGMVPREVTALYVSAGRAPAPHDGICLCEVVSVGSSSLVVMNAGLGSSTRLMIFVPLNDRHATTSGIMSGDSVMIAGDRKGDEIEAYGIRKVKD